MSLVPMKLRGDPRVLFGSPSFQGLCLGTSSPYFCVACQTVVSLSPRDTALKREECTFFPPGRGNILRGLKGHVAWEEGELVGLWRSGCCGLSTSARITVRLFVPSGWTAPISRALPCGQRQARATGWRSRTRAGYTWQFPFTPAECSPLNPFLIMPSSWTLSWIIKFTSNKILGRGVFQARRSRPQLLFQMSPDSEGP